MEARGGGWSRPGSKKSSTEPPVIALAAQSRPRDGYSSGGCTRRCMAASSIDPRTEPCHPSGRCDGPPCRRGDHIRTRTRASRARQAMPLTPVATLRCSPGWRRYLGLHHWCAGAVWHCGPDRRRPYPWVRYSRRGIFYLPWGKRAGRSPPLSLRCRRQVRQREHRNSTSRDGRAAFLGNGEAHIAGLADV